MPEYDLQILIPRRGWRTVNANMGARSLALWHIWLYQHPECDSIRIARAAHQPQGDHGTAEQTLFGKE